MQEYAPGLGVGGEVGDQKFGIQLSPPSMYGLIYNKDLMEQAGLTPPTTFDELLGFCADAREKLPDVAPIVMGGGDRWPLQLPAFQWVADAQAADPGLMDAVNRNEVTFSDPRFVDAFAKTKQLLGRRLLQRRRPDSDVRRHADLDHERRGPLPVRG